MSKIPKAIIPSLVGFSVYWTVNKFFPQDLGLADPNIENEVYDNDVPKRKIFKRFTRLKKKLKKKSDKIINPRAFKISLMIGLTVAASQHFHKELAVFLREDFPLMHEHYLAYICSQETHLEGDLKVVCDIIEKYELNFDTSIRKILTTDDLSNQEKISLLNIKLDSIFNGDCGGKKRFILLSALAIIITVSFSGLAGFTIFLEALYRLFQEGKLSRALYEAILSLAIKRASEVSA